MYLIKISLGGLVIAILVDLYYKIKLRKKKLNWYANTCMRIYDHVSKWTFSFAFSKLHEWIHTNIGKQTLYMNNVYTFFAFESLKVKIWQIGYNIISKTYADD